MSTDPFVPGHRDLSRRGTRRLPAGDIGIDSAEAGHRSGELGTTRLAVMISGIVLTIGVAGFYIETAIGRGVWGTAYVTVPLLGYAACRLAASFPVRLAPVMVLVLMLMSAAVSIGVFALGNANVWCLVAVALAILAWPMQLILLVGLLARSDRRGRLQVRELPVLPVDRGVTDSVRGDDSRTVLGLQRNPVSADRPYDMIHETEADGRGGVATSTTVFLTASECPVGCSMCDLWQNTLTGPTPVGAIPRQIRHAQNELGDARHGDTTTDVGLERTAGGQRQHWIKLYNSGNFFDRRSIPPSDYREIAELCRPYTRVIVENHPRIGASLVERFRDFVDGKLEVAVGLETVHPAWSRRMEKRTDRDAFDRFADQLVQLGVDLRVFLIFGFPGVEAEEAVRWTRLSARHAAWAGARHVSLIPARPGNGWGGAWDSTAASAAPSVTQSDQCHQAVLSDIGEQAVVTVDLWNAEASATTHQDRECLERIRRRNLDQGRSVSAASPDF